MRSGKLVTTKQITKTEFLELYSTKDLEQIMTVTVGTEQRIYARTAVGEGNNPIRYTVVYAVV